MRDDDLDLLAELEDPTPEQERIAAVLADLNEVIEARKSDTHYTDCHLDHAECLAARIRATDRKSVV